jgi:non-ribosomal peptide synthase protein (TIGR01720 family)
VVRAVLARTGPGREQRLLIAVHHLAVDAVSWPVLTEDLAAAYRQLSAGEPVRLPAKTTSFRAWTQQLEQYARSPQAAAELGYWTRPRQAGPLPGLTAGAAVADAVTSYVRLTAAQTSVLLRQAPAVLGAGVEDILLAGLAIAACGWAGTGQVLIDVEGHGRDPLFPGTDLSRTVGWFTTIHPLELAAAPGTDPVQVVQDTVACRAAVPGNGTGYGILAWLGPEPAARQLAALPPAGIGFNYLGTGGGQDQAGPAAGSWGPSAAPHGPQIHPANRLPHPVEVNAGVTGGSFTAAVTAAPGPHAATLAARYTTALTTLIGHATAARPATAATTAAATTRPGAGPVTSTLFAGTGSGADGTAGLAAPRPGELFALNRSAAATALFCLPASNGSVLDYIRLGELLAGDAAVLGFDRDAISHIPPGSASVEQIAAVYAQIMRGYQPHGPYLLAGWSFGGISAFEVARLVIQAGEQVALLCVIDIPAGLPQPAMAAGRAGQIQAALEELAASQDQPAPPAALLTALAAIDLNQDVLTTLGHDQTAALLHRLHRSATALSAYTPRPLATDITLYQAAGFPWPWDLTATWQPHVRHITHHLIPGHHNAPLTEPHVRTLAHHITDTIRSLR